MSPVQEANPPVYTVLDTGNPDGQFATHTGQMIISNCRDIEGNLNSLKLRKLLDMVVSYVNKETGVMPSVATTPATSIPPINNPTNPNEWDWSMWEINHLPQEGMRDMKYSSRGLICRILGGNLKTNENKINAVLEHTLFKASIRSKLDSSSVKNIVGSAQTCAGIIDEIFRHFQSQLVFSPTGMIKAAITLGYIPREEIQQLYDMSERNR